MIPDETKQKVEQAPAQAYEEATSRHHELHQRVFGRYYEPDAVPLYSLFYAGIATGAYILNIWLIIGCLVGIAFMIYNAVQIERRWSDTSDNPAVEIGDDRAEQGGTNAQ